MCCSGVLITGQDWRSYENEVLMKVLDLLAFRRVGTEYQCTDIIQCTENSVLCTP